MLGTELGWRAVLAMRGAGYDGSSTESACRELVDRLHVGVDAFDARSEQELDAQASSALQGHPFYGWDRDADGAVLARLVEYFASPEAESTFDVLIAEGSVSGSFFNHGREALAQRLAALPALVERPLRIHGGG